ncbi:MAG: type II CAAX endopeptidase family protein [Eubacteriales bacterium]
MEQELLWLSYPRMKRLLTLCGLAFFSLATLWLLASLVLDAVLPLVAPVFTESLWYPWFLTVVPLYVFAFPVCYLLLRTVKPSPPERRTPAWPYMVLVLPIGTCLMQVGNSLGIFTNLILGWVLGKDTTNPVADMLTGANLWIAAVVVVVIAPIMEELLFRKLLLDRIRGIGMWPAMLLSALFFGLFHGNFGQVYYAFGLGLLLAFVYLQTGRVRYTMLLHAIINFFGSVYPMLLMNGQDLTAPEDVDPLTLLSSGGFVIGNIVAAAAGLLLLILFFRKIRDAIPPGPVRGWQHVSLVYTNIGVLLMMAVCALMFVLSVFFG